MQQRRIDAGPRRHPRAGGALLSSAPPAGVAPGAFDQAALDLLSAHDEIDIETTRPDGGIRRTTIWVVVDGNEVFVRSVRGDRGHWFQAALDCAARAVDDESIARCSAALQLKYSRSRASLLSMLRSNTLDTTLRLEPRPEGEASS